jgi:hypothetical protein
MDDIFSRLSQDLHISGEVVQERRKFFDDVIKPKIKTKFLSHLVTTVEDLINEKRMREIINSVKEKKNDINLIKKLVCQQECKILLHCPYPDEYTAPSHNAVSQIWSQCLL